MTYVFDACALIAFFRGEQGKEIVEEILSDLESRFLLHSVNACEVYYDFIRSDGLEMARSVLRDIKRAGIEIWEDPNEDLWMQAGEYKATLKRVSLADCFARALTKRFNAMLVTSDHAEFNKIAESNMYKILFIR